MPHNLIIAKLHAFRFGKVPVRFTNCGLKGRNQRVLKSMIPSAFRASLMWVTSRFNFGSNFI